MTNANETLWSPVGRPIEEILSPRPRRQDLSGFEPVYSDIVDYILRCTHRIWEEKNVGLCRTHYGADCVVHTLAGETRGVDQVIANTLATLAEFPDRTLLGEDVIWSEDAPGRYHTSHRIISPMTHQGDGAFGTATHRRAFVLTIADCVCVENRIVEEWMARDNLWLARQLGLDPWAIAQTQAAADQDGDQERHAWRGADLQRVWDGQGLTAPPPQDSASARIARAFDLAINQAMLGEAAMVFSSAVEGRWPSGRRIFGRPGWIGAVNQLLAMLDRPAWVLDHWAETPLPGGDTAVALRWSIAGLHARPGVYGPATGRHLLVLGLSHFTVRNAEVIEDTTVFDDLAILRQIAGGMSQ